MQQISPPFLEVSVKTPSEVGAFIGGKVDFNFNKSRDVRFKNACAVRMSYSLNQSGVKIPYIASKTISGENRNWYIFRVKDIIDFLKLKLGDPDLSINQPSMEKLAHYKGILVVEVTGWSNASGHTTIWNGSRCLDEKCYFEKAKRAYLWKLKG
jgi:hypothetical protein